MYCPKPQAPLTPREMTRTDFAGPYCPCAGQKFLSNAVRKYQVRHTDRESGEVPMVPSSTGDSIVAETMLPLVVDQNGCRAAPIPSRP